MLSEKSTRNHTKPKITVTPYKDRLKQEFHLEKGIVRKRINIWEQRSPDRKVTSSETIPDSYYRNSNVAKEQKFLEASIGTYSECFSFLQDHDRKHPPSSSRLSILWSNKNKPYLRKIMGKDYNDSTITSIDCDSSFGGFSVLNYTTEGSMNDPFCHYDDDDIFLKKSFDEDKFHKDTYTNGKIDIGKLHDKAFIGGQIDNSKVCLEKSLNGQSTIPYIIGRNDYTVEEYTSLICPSSSSNSAFVEKKQTKAHTQKQTKTHTQKQTKTHTQKQTKTSTNFMVMCRRITRYLKDLLLFIFIVKFVASTLIFRKEGC